jgi:DNA-binding Xre family transcriptional regulator
MCFAPRYSRVFPVRVEVGGLDRAVRTGALKGPPLTCEFADMMPGPHDGPGTGQTTDLILLLAERGTAMSRPQVYRIVSQKPQRVALQVIAAICYIFSCGPEDLITVTAADVRARKTGTVSSPNVVDLNRTVRPRRPASSTMATELPKGLTPRNTVCGRPRARGSVR